MTQYDETNMELKFDDNFSRTVLGFTMHMDEK